MKLRIKQAIMTLAIVFGFGLALVPAPVGAVNVDPLQGACDKSVNPNSTVCQSVKNDNLSVTVTQVINLLLFIVGAISVIMIIVGGIFYTVSAGDAARITKAKFTIMYAVAGLIVSLLAYAIVNFVIGRFT